LKRNNPDMDREQTEKELDIWWENYES